MPNTADNQLKKYPFVRLLACLTAGIVLQWYLQLPVGVLICVLFFAAAGLAVFTFLPSATTFRLNWLRGLNILLLFITSGAIITYVKDVRHNPQWAGTHYQPGQAVLFTVEEPLVEKPKSWKVLASVTAVQNGGNWQKLYGKAILYFYKGKQPPPIVYGTQLILHKPLQPIKNSGNPGAFDYEKYCLLQGIAYQCFIYPGEAAVLPGNNGNTLQQALYNVRDAALNTLKAAIPGEKEQGVAEALLIGYRADLDNDLVQAYTNTGVIHIVAISGLHLAMIYTLLAGIWGLFKANRFTRIAKPASIFIVLWLFTLLAGAVPSIGRAAVMFSFLLLGEALGKRTNTYNNLAASAFFLLLYNPFYLWDAGFILSYSAVLSIVAFYRPVYNWFYIKNKLLNKVWEATAVTISAQILTVPVILFYFHQFANLFLLSNAVAVPLSGFVLYGELVILLFALLPPLAHFFGVITGFMIQCLDGFIQFINHMPYAVWANIYADVRQTLLFYACVIAAATWLLRRAARAFFVLLIFLTVLVIYSGSLLFVAGKAQKIIVYNVARLTAIDIMQGRNCHFIGDSTLLHNGPLLRYNLAPARIMYRASQPDTVLMHYCAANTCFTINHTKFLLLNGGFVFDPSKGKIPVDVIILSKKPGVSMAEINAAFSFKYLVFDSSNPMWKIRGWKKDCDSLHLRFYSVPEQGAFEMNL